LVSEHGAANTSRDVAVIWGNVPQRNKNFTGRGSLLDELRRRMTGEVTAVLPHALQGLGGVGKTQLAIEYAYRHARDYQVVWWIPADQPVLVRSTLAALAPRLGLTGISPERVEDAVRAVLDSLRRGDPYPRWLLIFDNADQPEAIRDLIPHGPGDVLVTSRNHRWQSLVDTVEVDVFTRAESLEFLSRRVPGADDDAYDRLAEELGDLPLALEQAGALQAETGISMSEYLELLNNEARKLLAENPPSDYPVPVAAAWSLAVTRVREQMPLALDLLRRCAFFGPEPIPRDLLERGRYVLGPPLREWLRDKIVFGRGLRELGRYALAKIDNNRRTVQIHRLIQKLLRDELSEDEAAVVRHDVHLLLAAADPGEPESLESWPKYRELLPHLGPSAITECMDADVRLLARNVVRCLYEIGDYTNCLKEIDQTLDRWQTNSRDDDRDVMELQGQKAWVLWTLGRYARAGEIRRANLEQARDVLGRDHEYTLNVTSGYGADLRARGEFVAALRLDEELLETHRRVFGPDDQNTLKVANNLAVDYCLTGQYDRARELDERSHQDLLVLYGHDDHPSVLVSRSAIARDLRLAGDYAAASRLGAQTRLGFERLTQIETLPDSHLWVLQQAKEYSIALRKAGDRPGALELAHNVFRQYQQAYGLAHPDTLSAAMCLGNAERLTGEVLLASRRIEDAVRRYVELWGVDHPFTHGCALNLAVMRRLGGHIDAAGELLAQALAGLQRTVGTGHHYTLMCRANIAVTAAETGNVAAAVKDGTDLLQEFRALLGVDHPHTLLCQANLAQDMRSLEPSKAAELLVADAHERLALVLGGDHPDLQDAIRGERLMFDFDPPPV